MTKDEAHRRLDEIGSEPTAKINLDQINDARRLVEVLPDKALQVLSVEQIRPEPVATDQLEFFWSRSAKLMDPGNRITRLQTLGGWRFAVLTGEPNTITWQRSPDGCPMPDVLALDSDGSEALLKQIIDWQIT